MNGKGSQLTPILKDLPSNSIHNAGRLRFGPDGKLYVSLGETDQLNVAQDLGSLAGRIRLVAENLGVMVHALRIEGNGIDVSTDSLRPGDTGLLEVDLPSGTYTLSCTIENHARMGMEATLTVVGP